jgi:hypothetical protein
MPTAAQSRAKFATPLAAADPAPLDQAAVLVLWFHLACHGPAAAEFGRAVNAFPLVAPTVRGQRLAGRHRAEADQGDVVELVTASGLTIRAFSLREGLKDRLSAPSRGRRQSDDDLTGKRRGDGETDQPDRPREVSWQCG